MKYVPNLAVQQEAVRRIKIIQGHVGKLVTKITSGKDFDHLVHNVRIISKIFTSSILEYLDDEHKRQLRKK